MLEKTTKIIQTTPSYSDYQSTIKGIKRVPEFLQFIHWFATPGQFKKPKNQKEFARSIGVCQDSLTDWKKHPQFWPLVFVSVSEWIREKIPDAIGGLYKRILYDGNPKAFETFLRLGGINGQEIKKINKK